MAWFSICKRFIPWHVIKIGLCLSLFCFKTTIKAQYFPINVDTLYQKILPTNLTKNALSCALKARLYFKDSFVKHQLLTVVDFSLESKFPRFFVIDLKKEQLLYQVLTTHGVNSGLQIATDFSNTINSYQSSLGSFKVAEKDTSPTHDTVLILDGLEKNINTNARIREIIIHRSEVSKKCGLQYCSQSFVDSFGFNGQSFGCTVLPIEVYKPIIDLLANGTLLYIFAPNYTYFKLTSLPLIWD